MPLKKGEPAMSALDECMNDQAGIADSLLAYATFMEDQVRLPCLRCTHTNKNLTKSCDSSPSPPFPHSPTLRTHPSTHLQTHKPHQHTHLHTHLYTPAQILVKLTEAAANYVAELSAIQKTGVDLLHLFDVADSQVRR